MRAALIAVLPITRAPRAESRWRHRITLRMRAGRLDRGIEAAGRVPPVGVLAMHAQRITGPAERARLCARLRRLRARVADRVLVAASVDEIAARLDGPRPVRARGMARLRMLLADGAGTGSVAASLRGVLAAL